VTAAERRFGLNRYAMAPQTGLHLARDLHPGARRQRGGGGLCAAQHLRRSGQRDRRLPTPRASPATHGRRRGRCDRGQDSGIRHRAAGAQLQGGGPGPGRAQPEPRRALPGAVCAAPGRRLRLADQHDADPAHPGRPRPRGQQAATALAGRRQRLRHAPRPKWSSACCASWPRASRARRAGGQRCGAMAPGPVVRARRPATAPDATIARCRCRRWLRREGEGRGAGAR
jgi:hypothetical protein